MDVTLMVAADEHDAIGRDNDLPWSLRSDFDRFRETTAKSVVVMGSRTFESIVQRNDKPLPGRISYVLSRTPPENTIPGVVFVPYDIDVALEQAKAVAQVASHDRVFVLGGSRVYCDALPYCDHIMLTRVHTRVAGADSFMPPGWLDEFELVLPVAQRIQGPKDTAPMSFLEYQRPQ